jgi:hypothetical protein
MMKKKTGQKKKERRTTRLTLVGHFSQQSRRLSQGDAEVGGTSCALNAPWPSLTSTFLTTICVTDRLFLR